MKNLAVNYHITRECNMMCKYCFATFEEPNQHYLSLDEKKLVLRKLSEHFDKITFVGGEPLLDKDLLALIRYSKELGMTTMLVSNGSMITDEFLKNIKNYLDWVSLSIDSLNNETNERIGRRCFSFKAEKATYLKLIKKIKKYGYKLKINTVVSKANILEKFGEFVEEVAPDRWKIFQVLKIENVNEKEFNKFKVSKEEFQLFLQQNIMPKISHITVAEDNNSMECSYYMVNPEGRIFDNLEGKMTYSESLLNINVPDALKVLKIDKNKFYARGGVYNW